MCVLNRGNQHKQWAAACSYKSLRYQQPGLSTLLDCRQELAAAIVSEGLRPLVNPNVPETLSSILEACWQLDSRERPSSSELVKKLRGWISQDSLSYDSRAAQRLSTKQREEARRAGAKRKDQGYIADKQKVATLKRPSWLKDTSPGFVKVPFPTLIALYMTPFPALLKLLPELQLRAFRVCAILWPESIMLFSTAALPAHASFSIQDLQQIVLLSPFSFHGFFDPLSLRDQLL